MSSSKLRCKLCGKEIEVYFNEIPSQLSWMTEKAACTRCHSHHEAQRALVQRIQKLAFLIKPTPTYKPDDDKCYRIRRKIHTLVREYQKNDTKHNGTTPKHQAPFLVPRIVANPERINHVING